MLCYVIYRISNTSIYHLRVDYVISYINNNNL